MWSTRARIRIHTTDVILSWNRFSLDFSVFLLFSLVSMNTFYLRVNMCVNMRLLREHVRLASLLMLRLYVLTSKYA